MVDVQALFQAIKAHDVKMLARLFTQTQARMGLSRFITDVVTPLTAQVGDAWMRGQLEVYEEHAYSEALQTCLRSALASLAEPTPAARPRVLLCTLSGELHGLGLLMAEAFLVLEGAHCTPLGTQMPLWDVVSLLGCCRLPVPSPSNPFPLLMLPPTSFQVIESEPSEEKADVKRLSPCCMFGLLWLANTIL